MKYNLKSNTILILFVMSIVTMNCSNSHEVNEVSKTKVNELHTTNFIEKSSVATTRKYKIHIQPSLLLKDKKLLKAHQALKKCEIKSDIIYYVSRKPGPGQYLISTVPAFCKLSLAEMRFYKTYNEETMFDSIKIDRIQYITNTHPGAPCFDLIINHVEANKLHLGPLTICGRNEKHKQEWIDAITKFKHCRLDRKSDAKTLVEFSAVNELNKKSALNALFYDGQNKAILTTKYGNDINSTYLKTLKEISTGIRSAKSQHNKLRRIMSGKLRLQRIATTKIIKKERRVRHNIDRHIRHAGFREEKMIKMLNKEKELAILTNLKQKILDLKVLF